MRQDFSYYYGYEIVFPAVLQVMPGCGYSVVSQDYRSGFISGSAGMSFASWGENLSVQLSAPNAAMTVVGVTSNLKFGLVAWGKNRRNVEKVHQSLSQYLLHLAQARFAAGRTDTARQALEEAERIHPPIRQEEEFDRLARRLR